MNSAVWYPFTQMSEAALTPVLSIARARGNYLYDTRGRKYLDGVSSLWCNVHGHQVPEIDRAIRRQLGRVAHSTLLGLTHPGAEILARKLVRVSPRGLNHIFYSDSGATAVEVALKMAYHFWFHQGEKQRARFLSFQESYHGDTLGTVAVGGIDLFHSIYKPLLFETVKVDPPYCYRCPLKLKFPSCRYKCLEGVEAALKKHQKKLSAFVIEPKVLGAGGIIVQPPGYLKRLAALAKKYRVPLIADEVATGFGRTGKMFACDLENVRPDLMCMAKGITGGYLPLAATAATSKIYQAFLGRYDQAKTFFHGHTYTGNPLACAAALASLDLFRKKNVIANLQPKINLLARELACLRDLAPVGDMRQAGMMVGIELVRNRATREPYDWKDEAGRRVCARARDFGVIIRPLGNVVVLMPPLSITPAQIRALIRAVSQSVQSELC